MGGVLDDKRCGFRDSEEIVAELFKTHPAEMKRLTAAAKKALAAQKAALRELNNEADAIFGEGKFVPLFVPNIFPWLNDGLTISATETPWFEKLRRSAERAARKPKTPSAKRSKNAQQKRKNKLELSLYELRTQLG